jgi:hypothetical protein
MITKSTVNIINKVSLYFASRLLRLSDTTSTYITYFYRYHDYLTAEYASKIICINFICLTHLIIL